MSSDTYIERYVNDTTRLIPPTRSCCSFIMTDFYSLIIIFTKICWITAGTYLIITNLYLDNYLKYIVLAIVINSAINLYRLIDQLLIKYNQQRNITISTYRITTNKVCVHINFAFYYIYAFFAISLVFIPLVKNALFILMVVYAIVEYGGFVMILLLIFALLRCGLRNCFPHMFIQIMNNSPIRFGASDEQLANLNYCVYNNSTIEPKTIEEGKPPLRYHDDFTCTICFDTYVNGNEIVLLNCQHHYHKQCCIDWLKINKTCPFCRAVIDI